MSRAGEWVLRLFCRPPGTEDYPGTNQVESVESACDNLGEVFGPRFTDLVRGCSVLDFGCGSGSQAIRLAQLGAAEVCGLDIRQSVVEVARQRAAEHGVSDRVRFTTTLNPSERFDFVLSRNSFEHFGDPEGIMRQMRALLKPGGTIMVTFSPPWFSPYGGHMMFFTRLPWAHLLFSEATVLAVRSLYRNDGAKRHSEIEGGLNMMSVRRWENLVKQSGMVTVFRRYDSLKGKLTRPLIKIPVVRELFVNRISALLRAEPAAGQSSVG